jgi:hypothetical protein
MGKGRVDGGRKCQRIFEEGRRKKWKRKRWENK